ncbi:MAG: FG-GAP repeat protein [Ignavibacteria bacterium]|nr:FG-GAP repeat protein [Ignavibacteria bacterium]
MTGEDIFNYYGGSVSTAGDVNGDGYSDIITGAWGFNVNIGRVYLYDYFMKNEIIPEITLSGEAANNYFGDASTAGDVNGDGYSDVIVGASGYNSNTGRAYIFYGGTSMDNTADVTFTGVAVNSLFGASVSTAGDINGDGYSRCHRWRNFRYRKCLCFLWRSFNE